MGIESPDTFTLVFFCIFGAAVAIILGVWILGAVALVRNRRVFRRAGIDPTTAPSQLAVRLIRGQASAPLPVADRLAELDDLRTRGLITAEEYAARRAQIIASI